MYSHSKVTTCTKLVTRRQYAMCSDVSEEIRSKLHLFLHTVKHGFFMGRSYGMIRSINFDPSSTYLAAICSDNLFFLYDPRFNRMIRSRGTCAAYTDGTSCITFLSTMSFATGSDDGRVALWDARNLTSPVKSVRGHEGFVRNIEYDEKSKRLYTSASDEQVLSWEAEAVSENYDVIMHIPQICRLKLALDGSKLLVTTQQSCLIIINNFCGFSFVEDMQNLAGVMDKIVASFYGDIKSTDMLQRHERQFLTRKKNAVTFHFAPPNSASVQSLCFHHSNELIAYRSLKKKPYYHYVCENICLYNVRGTFLPFDPNLDEYYSDFPGDRILAMKEDLHVASEHETIKEISFSPDGKVIASPSFNTVKLLAATSECPDLDYFLQSTSLPSHELYDLKCPLIEHKSLVTCCAFAPRDMMLATGCVDGEVYIHQPVL